jgi:hypothetical protein
MRGALFTLFVGAALVGCSDASTQMQQPNDSTLIALAKGANGNGTSFASLGDVGVLLAPPNFSPGSCLFVPDDQSIAGYIRTGPDGKQYLKVNDHSGLVIITPLGGATWVGTGRATIDWPNYKGSPADNVNMTVVGDVSFGGQTVKGSCHFLIAGGNKIQESLSLH